MAVTFYTRARLSSALALPTFPRPAAPPRACFVGVAAALLCVAAALSDDASWRFGLLMTGATLLWTTELLPAFLVALGLAGAWIALGLATPAQALAGFASPTWAFAVGLLGIGAATKQSGLLARLGALLARRLPHDLAWGAAALLCAGFLLGPLVPSATGRVALTAPVAAAVAGARRLRPGDPAAALLGLAAWIGAGPLMFAFLNGSSTCLLAWGLLPEASRQRFGWLGWLAAAAPLALLTGAGALAVLLAIFRRSPTPAPAGPAVAAPAADPGPMTRREIVMVVAATLTVCGLIAAPALGLDPRWLPLAVLLMAWPAGGAGPALLRRLDWHYLVFYAIALASVRLAESLPLARAFDGLGHALAGLGLAGPAFVLGAGALTLVVRLVMGEIQALLVLGVALLPAAPALGVEPFVVVAAILATNFLWLFPTQTPIYLVAHAAGGRRLYSHAQARRVALAYAAVSLTALALVLPYWRALGLV